MDEAKRNYHLAELMHLCYQIKPFQKELKAFEKQIKSLESAQEIFEV